MADELNIPTHRWYQPRYNISLPNSDFSKQWIFNSGIQKIDNWINGGSFSPSTLFSLAEPGVWFDPSDLTTLFTDPAGTTAVTTPGQTVGLMLDKSRGLALGNELITNPEFSSGSTGWLGLALSVIGGQASATNSSGTAGYIYQNVGAAAGKYYELKINIISVSGVAKLILNGGVGVASNALSTGITTVRLQNGSANGNAGVELANGASITIESLSIREVAGNHATQAITAARPTYSIEPVGGRRNLLTWSEDFGNAAWIKANVTVPTTQHTAPDGTVTADRVQHTTGGTGAFVEQAVTATVGSQTVTVSGYVRSNTGSSQTFRFKCTHAGVADYFSGLFTATSEWQRFSFTQAFGAGGTGVIAGFTAGAVATDLLIWGAQLELGSTATNYQKVTTTYDVTEAGVASVGYLYFDGVSNFMGMATSTITPGTDKVQVFAGVRKLSDATPGCLVELGSSISVNARTFALFAPGTGGSADYYFGTRGTALQNLQTSAVYPAPISNVVTALSDISGDTASLRVNGTQAVLNTGDQGTGNFDSYPLNVGRRSGGTLPFKGHLYSLITRFGPTLDAPTITSTEIWVAGKTGITI